MGKNSGSTGAESIILWCLEWASSAGDIYHIIQTNLRCLKVHLKINAAIQNCTWNLLALEKIQRNIKNNILHWIWLLLSLSDNTNL